MFKIKYLSTIQSGFKKWKKSISSTEETEIFLKTRRTS